MKKKTKKKDKKNPQKTPQCYFTLPLHFPFSGSLHMLPLLQAEVYEGPYHQQSDLQLPPMCKSKRFNVSLIHLFFLSQE